MGVHYAPLRVLLTIASISTDLLNCLITISLMGY